jgi:peptidoglycan/LPS O-acetylase OafA/YrhL
MGRESMTLRTDVTMGADALPASHIPVPAKAGSWRWDIQILRGWAIALVIIDHADAPIFSGGFLGVDIFFVISGFLMTSLIVQGLDRQDFTFRGFFARRVRRLLPAAYSTLIVTGLVAPFLLDPYELMNFIKQMLGAFTFSINFVLWGQIDYFNSQAALKPLLHMWSLSLEEQYYIVLPLLLFFCPRRLRLPLAAVCVAVSLAACLYVVQKSPSAAFYFLPFRAWELGFGSLTALLVGKRSPLPDRFVATALRWLCGLILVVVPLLVDERGHPGFPAILVCLATAVLIGIGSPRDKAGPLLPLAWIGNRSYSLYLVHWPLFAFANNMFIHKPDAVVRVSLVVVCFVLAELQYRLVEQRFRKLPLTLPNLGGLVTIPVIAVAVGFGWYGFFDHSNMAFRRESVGLSAACVYRDNFAAKPECQTSSNPQTMVWGDSFAMAVVPGLAGTLEGGLIQATRSVCGPFLDVAPFDGNQYKEPWARSCMRFNQSVLGYLRDHPEIHTVVLSSAMAQYVPGEESVNFRLLVKNRDESYSIRPLSVDTTEQGLANTADALHAMGKRVVLIAPPPSTDFDIGRCLERQNEDYLTVFPETGCNIDVENYRSYRSSILDFVKLAQQKASIGVIDFSAFLCGKSVCATRLAGVPLYRDGAHLSIPGAQLLGKEMDLPGAVLRLASGAKRGI